MLARASLLALFVSLAGCVQSNTLVCGDLICPAGAMCDELGRCIRPGQVAACDGKADGDACTLDNADGACRAGACILYFCGDGYVTLGEQCDGSELGGETCVEFGYYDSEGLACNDLCRFDVSACTGGTCGDELVNGPELCDGPQTRSCVSLGFDVGSVHCDALCAFTIRDCSRFGWNSEAVDLVALAVGGSSRIDQWAVGMDGRAARFDGAEWTAIATGVASDLRAVWGNAPDDVWVVGNEPAVVLHWTGTAWTPVSAPTATYLDVWATSATSVYIATQESGVLHFDGATWTPMPGLAGEVFEVHGTADDDIWAAAADGLRRWNGSAWTLAPLGDTRIRFLDANTRDDVWAVGEAKSDPGTGVIAHWDGTAWSVRRTPREIYNAVASSAPNDAWLVVAGGQLRHFDGTAWAAATVVAQSPSGPAQIAGMHSFDANEVVAVSTLRLAFRYRGQTFGQYPEMRLFPESNPFTSAVTTDLWSAAADALYVTNVKGEVLRFDGTRWSVMFAMPPDPARPSDSIIASSIWGASPSAIWVANQRGSVYHYDGVRWTGTALAPEIPIDHVWGTSATNVYALGRAGVFRYNGTDWQRIAQLGNGPVLGVSGTGPDDIWVVEKSAPLNTLWHYTNGAWSIVPTGTTTELTSVVAAAPDVVLVSAIDGHLLYWNGATWRDDRVAAAADLVFLTASGPQDVFAASERELFHFDGVQWSPMRTPVEFVPNTPDYFPITGLQASPARVDVLLQKWRVRTLLRTRPFVCELEERCGDAVDNDCDGALDSADGCP